MITLEIPETKRRIYLPENLGECDSQQYAEACMLMYRYRKGELSYPDFRVEMVYKLLNLKKGGGKLVKSEVEDMHSNIYRISTLIESFFIKEEDNTLSIVQGYIHNHSRTIRDAFRKWYGPKDAFENISFGQYLDGLNLFSLMEKEVTKQLLYELMATFYLGKGKVYDENKVEENARHFRHVYFGRVYGFYLLFASFQQYLFGATVIYEGKELDLSILYKNTGKQSKSNIPGLGMLSIAHQLSESQVFGPMKQLREENFWKVILQLYDIRKRDIDHEMNKKKDS